MLISVALYQEAIKIRAASPLCRVYRRDPISQSNSYAALLTLGAPEARETASARTTRRHPMTTLILNGTASLPSLAHGLRLVFARLGDAIDAAVSARAARAVPESQMRQVQADIRRYLRPARRSRRRR